MINLSDEQKSDITKWLLDKGLGVLVLVAAVVVLWMRTEQSIEAIITQMERMEKRAEERDRIIEERNQDVIKCYEERLKDASK